MKHAKKAFLASLLSTLLCVTMLIGTTFAWFTDSVTSGGNKILSGTLDIDLYQVTATGESEITDSSAPIFGSGTSTIAQNNNADTLWEPGKTQIAYLKLKNNGNLWLKYTVKLVVKNVSKNLYEAMQYKVIPDATYNTLDTLTWTTLGGLAAESLSGTAIASGATATVSTTSQNVPMAPEAEHFFALAIHMNEEAGNQYQAGEVDFDIQVLATQYTKEEDSFGPDYDELADETPDNAGWFDETSTATATVTAGDPTVLTANAAPTTDNSAKTKVTFAADALTSSTVTLNVTTEDAESASATAYNVLGDNTAVGAIDLTLYENGSATTTTTGFGTVIVETVIATGLADVTIVYNGNATDTFGTSAPGTKVASAAAVVNAGDYYYNSTSGQLVFATDHFSEYLIKTTSIAYSTTTDSAYASIQAAVDATQNGDTVILLNDFTDGSYAANNTETLVEIRKSITLDGKGHTIACNAGRTIAVDASDVSVVVKDLTSNNTATFGGGYPRGFQIHPDYTNVKMTVENCAVSAKYYAFNFCSGTSIDVDIKDSTFTGWAALNIWSNGVSINAEDSTFVGVDISPSEAFGTITLEGDTTGMSPIHAEDMVINLKNCTVAASGSYQFPFEFNNSSSTGAMNNVVNMTGGNIVSDFSIGTATDGEETVNVYVISYDMGSDNALNLNGTTLNGSTFETYSFWSGKGLAGYKD